MVTVKCVACNKRYGYKEHGCCPACGAYNRPPRRDRVNADGTVYHMSDSDFLENKEARRRSQGSKVCFEQDVCYEDQARQVRHGEKSWEDHLNDGIQWLQQQGRKRQGKIKTPKQLVAVIVVLVLVSVLPTILTTCADAINNMQISGPLEEIISGVDAAVKPDRLPNSYYYESNEALMGETFEWWGAKTVVVESSIVLSAEENQAIVLVEGKELREMPMLYYYLPDGTEVCQSCDTVEEIIAGRAHKYYYQVPDMHEAAGCYLEFTGYNGDTHCTTKVWLT